MNRCKNGEKKLTTANIITGIRIVCALSLIFCPTFSVRFYAFYIIGGISDILDGIIARKFHEETKFGAKLDTVADIVFTMIVMIKILHKVYVPVWLIIWIICIAVIKCFGITIGFVIYKRFISEHTVINKICGILLFFIPFCIGNFSRKSVEILIILTALTATVAAIKEGYYIFTGKEIV